VILGAIGISDYARALTPEQVAVVVNMQSEGSKLVAKHYMLARQLPAGNMVEINVDPLLRGWSEPRYRQAVADSIRKQLVDKKIADKVTCLVTTFDVPLSIPETGVGENDKVEFGAHEKRLRDFYGMILGGVSDYDGIAAAAANPAATQKAVVPNAAELKAAQEKLIAAANGAVKRIEQLPADLRGAEMEKFSNIHLRYLGPAGVIAAISVSDNQPGAMETRKRLETMKQEVSQANKRIAELNAGAMNARTREELFTLKLANYGAVGAANQTMEFVQRLNPADTSACLDSELALLWHEDYVKTRWLDNPLSLSMWPAMQGRRIPRIMMVARLDGVSPQSTIAMINQTLKTEKEGLTGVAYFDARGIKTSGYEPFDRDLMETADYLTKNSTMKVVLDKNEALLQAANCPDAAIYCGWYSLRNYQDSCQWKAGGVGYHVASWEMMALHDEREKGWVANLVKRGICGTLGATEEPYLPAFPKPSQFFPLLMCGEFTQGEVYFVTVPWLSWRIGFVGDPLYNPFKAKPAVDPVKVKQSRELSRAYDILGAMGMGPTGK
jgi:uncharacterized protein (TIGR03790 family)